jgi:hypothetical protein
MYKGLCFILLIFISTSCFAGRVSELFSDGAFGVSWGASAEEVKKAYPTGTEKVFMGIKNYIVPHSKSIIGIERSNTDITFTFNKLGEMHAIGISFEGNEFTDVYSALTTHFGKHKVESGTSAIRWPIEDDISMYLVSIPTGFSIKPTLTIEYVASAGNASKKELGFK